MICTPRTTGEHHAGCSKSPDFSSSQPWRLFHPPALSLPRQTLRPETRLIPCKAATEADPRFTVYASRFTVLRSDVRTPLGERRVSVRRGWAGEKSDLFSILSDATLLTQALIPSVIRSL
jgi:hypothetical protein